MGARRRKAPPLRRAVARRPERRTVVVFCEGKDTEPSYVNGLRTLPQVELGTAIDLQVHPERGVPLKLVQMAIRKSAESEVDECWCLFDVEWPHIHPRLAEAITLAQAHNVRLAISNPCFELWLILHHEDHHQFLATEDAERRSMRLDGRSGKSIEASLYLPLRGEAIRRAELLALRHERESTSFPGDNPSSGMYEFIRAVAPVDDVEIA